MKLCIVSKNARFSRMVELELKNSFENVKRITRTVGQTELMLETDNCDAIVLDADYFDNDLTLAKNIKKPIVVLAYAPQTNIPENVRIVINRPFFAKELVDSINECVSNDSISFPSIQPKATVVKLELDLYSKQVKIGEKIIKFSPKEFSLLCLLYKNRGKIVSRKTVLDTVWGKDYDQNNNVDNVYINYLRKKLDEPLGTKIIYTVRGKGYMIK